MSRIIYTSVFLLFLLPCVTRASELCQAPKNAFILRDGKDASCEKQKTFDDFITQVAAIAPKSKVPVLVTTYSTSSMNGEFHFPASLVIAAFGSGTLIWQATLAHEYGHFIYSLGISRRAVGREKDLSGALSRYVQDVAAAERAQSLFNECKSRGRSDVECGPLFMAKILSLDGDEDLIGSAGRAYSKYENLALSELFADIYAAVLFSDPSLIANVFNDESRSFSRSGLSCGDSDPHSTLACVRSDMWKYVIEPQLVQKKDLIANLTSKFVDIAFDMEVRAELQGYPEDTPHIEAKFRKAFGLPKAN